MAQKNTKKSLLKSKELKNKYSGTTLVNLQRDAKRKAKPSGKRTTDHGTVYYEERPNRTDSSAKKYPMLENGGAIHNAYEGKSPEQVWEEWETRQRIHFLNDHTEIGSIDEKFFLAKQSFISLPIDIVDKIDMHVWEGQYEEGGEIEDDEAPLKKYKVTLWRYPSDDREENKVGESVFYFDVDAANEEDALEQAKEQFEHSVYESDVQEEEDDSQIDEITEGVIIPTEEQEEELVPEDEEDEEQEVVEAVVDTYVPEHFGTGRNINVFGYETANFDVCATAVEQFEAAIQVISEMSDTGLAAKFKKSLVQLAVHVDAIFSMEKQAISDGVVDESSIKVMTKNLVLIGLFDWKSGLNVDTSFLGNHVSEICKKYGQPCDAEDESYAKGGVVKNVDREVYEKFNLSEYPNFHKTGNVKGMTDKYYGKDALLVKHGDYIYNVSSSPDIYYNESYAKGGEVLHKFRVWVNTPFGIGTFIKKASSFKDLIDNRLSKKEKSNWISAENQATEEEVTRGESEDDIVQVME